jgi:hypothetical protein
MLAINSKKKNVHTPSRVALPPITTRDGWIGTPRFGGHNTTIFDGSGMSNLVITIPPY